jgi:hypothetical protein
MRRLLVVQRVLWHPLCRTSSVLLCASLSVHSLLTVECCSLVLGPCGGRNRTGLTEPESDGIDYVWTRESVASKKEEGDIAYGSQICLLKVYTSWYDKLNYSWRQARQEHWTRCKYLPGGVFPGMHGRTGTARRGRRGESSREEGGG